MTEPSANTRRRRHARGALTAILLLAASAQAAQAASAVTPAYVPTKGAPVCRGVDGYAASFGGRRTFLLNPDSLQAIKARFDDPALAPAREALMKRADAALAGPVYSVVDKTKTPLSHDKHDYMSIGPYWWPDPDKPGGEPYVRRDGQFNPQRDTEAFDTTRLEKMSGGVEALSLAYYFTGEQRYADKAAQLLKVWFLDPATRMNPNAAFAQAVPGRNAGRAEGVLDTFRLQRVVEAIGLLAPSGVIKPADQKGLETWFGDYVAWMQSSPTGKEEQAAENNHGIWFDYQITQYALFSRHEDVAKGVVERFPAKRIDPQIEPDGKLPRELTRTRALHYSVFALEAATGVAELGRCLGADLWRYQAADGRGLRRAIDFIAPYAGREAAFPYPDLRPQETAEMFELLSRAAWAYGEPAYARAAALQAPANAAEDVNLRIPPYAPR